MSKEISLGDLPAYLRAVGDALQKAASVPILQDRNAFLRQIDDMKKAHSLELSSANRMHEERFSTYVNANAAAREQEAVLNEDRVDKCRRYHESYSSHLIQFYNDVDFAYNVAISY